MPQFLLWLPRFLRFGRPRSPKPDNTSNAADLSRSSTGGLTLVSRPSSGLGTPHSGHSAPPLDSKGHGLDNPTSQGAHASEIDRASVALEHSIGPAAQLPAPSSQATNSHSSQHQDLSNALATTTGQSSRSGQLTPIPSHHLPDPCEESSTLAPATVPTDKFINNASGPTVMHSAATNSSVMGKLLEKTIRGAAFDSSSRDPPPRCHPGTRLAVLKRCIEFIVNCTDQKKLRWVFGSAGVGKSAVMQSVAEYPLSSVHIRASIFFFVNGRNDGNKSILTLAYQLALECEPYRQFIDYEISRDPSLLQSSLSMQFQRLVVEPFIHHPPLHSVGRILIIIDGLDECDDPHTQRELLRLISEFCIAYPSSPIAWIIASRPEPHITSFFAQSNVEAAYEKEEVLVDADDAREDVERYLRSELAQVQNEFSLHPETQWPSEHDFWKLASASGGLFVYAYTIIKYIRDPAIGNPTIQLYDVLKVIDAHPLPDIPRERHPMALLDALYAHILSKVSDEMMVISRKILLGLVVSFGPALRPWEKNLIVLCNWLGVTRDDVYAATCPLGSLLHVPTLGQAHEQGLRPFHKSFLDYLSDFSRSGFSPDIQHEAHQLDVTCTFRVLEEAPQGVDFGEVSYKLGLHGILARGPGTGDDISLTWLLDEEVDWGDNETRLSMYKLALENVVDGIKKGDPTFRNMFCVRLLTTRFKTFGIDFPSEELHDFAVDDSLRQELAKQGILQTIPIKVITFSDIKGYSKLRFRRPTASVAKLPTKTMSNLCDPWNPTCTHLREGEWGEGKDQDWTTKFDINESYGCTYCRRRFEQQLESSKAKSQDLFVLVLFSSTGECFVEFKFVDSEDSASEWTYRFVQWISAEERKKYGSTV